MSYHPKTARALCFGIVALVASTVHGQSDSKENQPTPKPKTQVQWAALAVRLVDEAGEPVEGAGVMPYGMQMAEQEGWGYWEAEVMGPPKFYVSNGQGIAKIAYPSSIVSNSSPTGLSTSLVTFKVIHDQHVTQIVHCSLQDASHPITEIEIQLQRACEVHVSAQSVEGKPISNFMVMMSGFEAGEMWENMEENGMRSNSVRIGNSQAMLVKPESDGRTLFSGLFPVRTKKAQTTSIKNVVMSAGAELHGVLSANTPRPVKNCRAMIAVAPKAAGSSWDTENASLVWYDVADVKEDGTFFIPSIPRSGEVQVIVVCDGWISTTTIPETYGDNVMGQLFKTNDARMDIEVQMEETGVLEVTLLTPSGQPLKDGVVNTWPAQRIRLGGASLLGKHRRSLALLENGTLPLNERVLTPGVLEKPEYFPFMNQPVIAGQATLRGIPLGFRRRLVLDHARYLIPSEDGEGHVYELTAAEPNQRLTIQVVDRNPL